MITIEQSEYLLGLEKKIEQNGVLLDNMELTQKFPFTERYFLISPDDSDFTFLYDIFQSKKNQLLLSFYLMDNDSKVGLLRVDYNGSGHVNPESINEHVPEKFKRYAGKHFAHGESHIHYYVEGYKSTLDWAIPISNDIIPVNEIKNPMDIIAAFESFNKLINLVTHFKIIPAML